jgi:hypothetical protein
MAWAFFISQPNRPGVTISFPFAQSRALGTFTARLIYGRAAFLDGACTGTKGGALARRLTTAEREELAVKAWRLSAKGWGLRRIAARIKVNHKTVPGLLEEERIRRREEWKDEDIKSLAFYQEVIEECEERLERMPDRSQNVSALENAKITARTRMDKITGVEAPTKTESKHNHEVHKEYANTPIEDLLELEELAQRVFGDAEG